MEEETGDKCRSLSRLHGIIRMHTHVLTNMHLNKVNKTCACR